MSLFDSDFQLLSIDTWKDKRHRGLSYSILARRSARSFEETAKGPISLPVYSLIHF